MKITKRQLRKIIKEEKAKLLRENKLSAKIADADQGRMIDVSARPDPFAGFVSLAFGNSYRIALDGQSIVDLVNLLNAAQDEMRTANRQSRMSDEDNSASVGAFTKAVPGSERA